MTKRILIGLAVLSVAAFGPHAGLAQDTHDHEHDRAQMDPEAMQRMMELMQPGEQHEKLDFWTGTWKTNVRHAMTGESTEGTYTYEWSLGKRYLVGNYSGTMMGMPFEGMSIDGYDRESGEYFSLWMDTMGTGFLSFTGRLDGENSIQYTGSGKDPMTGADIDYRNVSTRTGDDSFTFVMYITHAGDPEMKVLEIEATRI